MKKILLLLIVFGVISCDLSEKYHLRSFVMSYYDAEDMRMREDITSDLRGIYIYFHYLSSLGNYESTGELKDSYDALCEKHGDMTYDRTVKLQPHEPVERTVLGIDFVSLDIVSDADFDIAHPAGKSLGDVVLFRSKSLKPYIDSGYKGRERTTIEEYASKLTANRLILLGNYDFIGGLYFESQPTLSKTHTFTVTMTADDGRVFSDSIEMTFE